MKKEIQNKRGYCGIAFFEPKFEENIGSAIRNCHCFSADFICIIGKRYSKTPADTTDAKKHIPVYEYKDIDDFTSHIPIGCELISVEVDGEDIKNFKHPQRAIYIFGGEDRTLPAIKGTKRIKIDTKYCLNMAVTSAVILFSRNSLLTP